MLRSGITCEIVVDRLVTRLWETFSLALPCPAEESYPGLVLCRERGIFTGLLRR